MSALSDALSQHLPSYLGFSYLGHGVSLHSCSSKVQPLLLTLDEVPSPNLECGVAVENSERDGNTRPPDLPLEKFVCRSESNSQNWTWNNRLVPIRKRSMSRLYIVTVLNLYAEYIMRNAGLEEAQLASRLPGEISVTSDMQMTAPL